MSGTLNRAANRIQSHGTIVLTREEVRECVADCGKETIRDVELALSKMLGKTIECIGVNGTDYTFAILYEEVKA